MILHHFMTVTMSTHNIDFGIEFYFLVHHEICINTSVIIVLIHPFVLAVLGLSVVGACYVSFNV